jgi:hypothetical protein
VKESFYEKLDYLFDKFSKYHMKILLGNFNSKVGKEDIFKRITGDESLHEIKDGNGVRIVQLAATKNLTVRNTMLSYHIATSINILGRLQMGNPTIRLTIFW